MQLQQLTDRVPPSLTQQQCKTLLQEDYDNDNNGDGSGSSGGDDYNRRESDNRNNNDKENYRQRVRREVLESLSEQPVAAASIGQVHSAWVSIETDIDTDIADSGATSGSTSATGGSAGGDNEPLGHKHRDNIENKENIDNIDKRGKKKVAVKVLRPDVRR